VAELGLPLVRIEQRRHRLEDLFRDGPDGGPISAADADLAGAPAVIAPSTASPSTPPSGDGAAT
jgi:hypothetical protein